MRFLVIAVFTLVVVTVIHAAPDDNNLDDLDQLDQETQPQLLDSEEQLIREEDDEAMSRTKAGCKKISGVCLKSKNQCLKRKKRAPGWKLGPGGRQYCGRSRHCCVYDP